MNTTNNYLVWVCCGTCAASQAPSSKLELDWNLVLWGITQLLQVGSLLVFSCPPPSGVMHWLASGWVVTGQLPHSACPESVVAQEGYH